VPNKAQFVEMLAERLDGDRKRAAAALDAVIDSVYATIARGEKVAITGFGVFERRDRAARVARNPATGERVDVAPSRVPAFRPGAEFKAIASGAREAMARLRGAAAKKSAPAKKSAAKTAPAKKSAAKTAPAKKSAAKAAPAKSSAAKKTAAKKTAAKKSAPAKSAAKKTATKAPTKAPAKKAATKAPANKAAKKAPAKRK
jgi:DNA-binding protein HU-beta